MSQIYKTGVLNIWLKPKDGSPYIPRLKSVGFTGCYCKIAEALQLYETACRQGAMNKLWSTLTGHSRRLFDLETVRRTVNVRNRHYAGLQTVPICHICGSEGRKPGI